MAFDSLKNMVREFGTKRSELEKEQQEYDIEQGKLDALSSVSAYLDDEIINAVGQIQDEFSKEKSALDGRADDLRSDRDDLEEKINSEQAKIDAVQKKIDGLLGKRYTKPLNNVTQRCDALLSELDEMLKDIGGDGGSGPGGSGSFDSLSGAGGTNDSFGNPGGAGDSARGVSPKDGGVRRIFGRNQAAPSGPKLGNFDLAPIAGSNDFFVRGTNYDQFIHDYYNSEQSTYEDLGDNAIITTIQPGQIEGIHLGETEAADSSVFWSQHESGGTQDSFVEIASHIPEVNDLLQSGLTLNEIRENPSLERCVDIYFDPSNIPRVVQSNGYYEFDTNGRHRILAAREAGYNIPVKVIGIRRWI